VLMVAQLKQLCSASWESGHMDHVLLTCPRLGHNSKAVQVVPVRNKLTPPIVAVINFIV